jgi:hypothetical protein
MFIHCRPKSVVAKIITFHKLKKKVLGISLNILHIEKCIKQMFWLLIRTTVCLSHVPIICALRHFLKSIKLI